jgi:hypothetical protein
MAVRAGRYKFAAVAGTPFWQLFDVVDDPGEERPLGPEHKETARAFGTRLQQWQAEMKQLAGLWGEGSKAELSPEMLQRLRSLGYIR